MKTNVHDLKCWPEFFVATLDGRKTFEFRRDDRGFLLGDILWLREYRVDNEEYTGRSCRVLVTFVQREPDIAIPAGYIIMGIRLIDVVTASPDL